MDGDGEIRYSFYSDGELTNQGLRDIARRCESFRQTHGDIAVIKFEPTISDGRRLGVSYRQIAAAFKELADLREREEAT
jgi:hypothetical protein